MTVNWRKEFPSKNSLHAPFPADHRNMTTFATVRVVTHRHLNGDDLLPRGYLLHPSQDARLSPTANHLHAAFTDALEDAGISKVY